MTLHSRLQQCSWRTIMVVSLVAITGALLPLHHSYARGVFWQATKRATDAAFDHVNPVLVAYHNHAYALSVGVNGAAPATSVYFSTNESKHWVTTLLTNRGPKNAFGAEDLALTVDQYSGKLYAIWPYQVDASQDAIGVWTRTPGGQWAGPTNLMTALSLNGQPSIVARDGKVYAAFTSSAVPTSTCTVPGVGRAGDIDITSNTGSGWSSPINLTGCVADRSILTFDNPKLAVDEAGTVSLVTIARGDLWYAESAGGTWTSPAKITRGANIPYSVGASLITYYGVAASQGTAYVAYVRYASPSYDVLLTTHSSSGSWSPPLRVSPADKYGCPKFGMSIVANAGRVGVSYVRGHLGYCHASTGIFTSNPFLFAGNPGHMVSISGLQKANTTCYSTYMASEGALFRFLSACLEIAPVRNQQLYYKAEFLDTVGPVSRLYAPSNSRAPGIILRWSARDPHPGSGVAFYQLQVWNGSGPWRTVLSATRATRFTYRNVHAGQRYIFRLRARDRTANWGKWVTASSWVH